MNTNNQVAPAPKTSVQKTIRNTLAGDYFRQQVAMCLPKHLTAERFIRMALTALMRTPKLADCTEASVTKCMLTLSELGIEPDGRRAHLIPFKNNQQGTYECTLIVDWKGLAELAMRSGMISKLHADLICDKDEFAYDLGDILHHRIDFRQDRGKPYAAYAMAVTKDGHKFVSVMTQSEIEKVRDGSQGWKAFQKGYAKQSPWQDSPGEMWKKTAFRRLSKWLPLSPEIHDALDKDEPNTAPSSIITTDLAPPPAPELEAPPIEANPEKVEVVQQQDNQEPEPGEVTKFEGEPPAPTSEPHPQKPAQTPLQAPKAPRGAAATATGELEKCIGDAGHNFGDFVKWADGVGVIADASSLTMFSEIKEADAKRLLRARAGMLAGIAQAKGGAV